MTARTTQKKRTKFYRRSLLTTVSVFSAVVLSPLAVHAQDDADDDAPVAVEQTQADDDAPATGDRLRVTGTRLQRDDEFTSISPLQVLEAEVARNLGIFGASDIIAQSTIVTGTQFDATTNSGSPTAAVEGVPENGVGSTAVALRGIGPENTLVLVNNRRLAPSGVRGAPIAPDLSLIPSSMIDRIDVLADGASSIYGADAVAGVVNIILREDVEGLEFDVRTSQPFDDGGEEFQVSFITGVTSDRSNITLAGEFFNRSAVLAGDRDDFTDGCVQDIEETEDGRIFSVCADPRPDNAVLIASQGFLYNAPGVGSGSGVFADWVPETELSTGEAAFLDIYNLQDEERATQLRESQERYNLFATGYYDLDVFKRDRLYFEFSYNNRNSVGRFTSEQVFPGVPALIPQEDANGNIIVDSEGAPVLVDNPLNPFDEDALPVISLADLTQRRVSNIDNFRAVGGLEGDVPLAFMEARNWTYDFYVAYENSRGTASQRALNEFALRESLDTLRLNSDGELICGLDRGALSFGFITPNECVPVNFFSPTLFETQGGDKTFATEAETEFLFGNVVNTTELEQTVVSGFFQGEVFDLPAGAVGLAFGGEFRENRINSVNDLIRSQGLAASEIPDQEGDTVGRTSLGEFFAETEVPLLDNLSINASGRYTEEENAGARTTYSVRARYAPTEFLTLRGTYGTSFRAPNLREQFLSAVTGTIGGGNDPCLVPQDARPGGVYDPALDPRDQTLLDNCIASGADPTQLGALATTGIPFTNEGGGNLTPEDADSYTAGFVFTNTFTDAFDFDLAFSYFNIEIENRIVEVSAADLLSDCFNGPAGLADPACARISRNTGDPATATIANVSAGFINQDSLKTSGFDVSSRFGFEFNKFGRPFDAGVVSAVTYYEERTETTDGVDEELIGIAGNPEITFLNTATLSTGNWNATWRLRYIDDFAGGTTSSDAFALKSPTSAGDRDEACAFAGIFDTPCRDLDSGDAVWYNDFALTYDTDLWGFNVGIANAFNTEPPTVDQGQSSIPTRSNVVVQSGYDVTGRRVFAGFTRRF